MLIPMLIFLLGYVIWTDMTKRKIFNTAWMLILVVGILFFLFDSSQKISPSWRESLTAMGLCFAIFLSFYRLGWMGAGDVKLGAALAFCLGIKAFFYVWVISIGVGLLYSLGRWAWGRYRVSASVLTAHGRHVPYGAALGLSSIFWILMRQ